VRYVIVIARQKQGLKIVAQFARCRALFGELQNGAKLRGTVMKLVHSRFTVSTTMSVTCCLAAMATCPVLAAPSQQDFLHRKMSKAERRAESEITLRLAISGDDRNNPPVRNKKDEASYLGMDDEHLWKEIDQSEGLALIGLKAKDRNRGFFNGKSLLSDAEFDGLKREILAMSGVVVDENTERRTGREISVPKIPSLQFLTIRIGSMDVLTRLRGLDIIDWVEPARPQVIYANRLDCGGPPAYAGSSDDTMLTNPAQPDVVPWAYAHLAIPEMWRLADGGTRLGKNVNLIITDTGLYPTQAQFTDFFNTDPRANSRMISNLNWTNSTNVKCSHGTRIAGIAAAPADGSARANIVGVAPGANVRIEKIGDGVIPFDTPTENIVSAILDAASAQSTDQKLVAGSKRVVLMAWGMPYASEPIRDAIRSAFVSNPNVIFVAAAGTTTPVPIFPATMQAETFAVSIVDTQSTANFGAQNRYRLNTPANVGPGDTAAYGQTVDLVSVNSSTVYTPTTGPGVNAQGMATNRQGNVVPVSSLDTSTTWLINPISEAVEQTREVTTIGGSSSGVAILGGAIAAAWSRMPWLTREQLLARIQASATCANIAGLDGACNDWAGKKAVGHGIPDMYVAAGGSRDIFINGTAPQASGQTFQVSVGMVGEPSFFTFRWNNGATGDRQTLTLQPNSSQNICVTATNRFDGTVLNSCRVYTHVGGSPTTPAIATSFIFSTATAEAYSAVGNSINVAIGMGAVLPSACTLDGVFGQQLTIGPPNPWQPIGTAEVTANRGANGFTVSRTASNPNGLGVLVHAWHNLGSAIRVRAAYRVLAPQGTDCNVPGVTQSTP
jgi:Subtilase family